MKAFFGLVGLSMSNHKLATDYYLIKNLFVYRYVSHENEEAASLYYAEGAAFQRNEPGKPATVYGEGHEGRMPQGADASSGPTPAETNADCSPAAGAAAARLSHFSCEVPMYLI